MFQRVRLSIMSSVERIVFVSGPMEGRIFELTSSEVTVGREPTSRLQLLGDRCVSRRHARIVRRYGGLFIEDVGSKNGVIVNGEKVTEPVALKPGDQIQITNHMMRVEWSPSAFGPPTDQPSYTIVEPQPIIAEIDRVWLWGLVPSLLFAPLGVVLFHLSGIQLVPFAIVLTGLALACVGIIRFYKPAAGTSAFERAFIQTLSGSALTILGALWLNALK